MPTETGSTIALIVVALIGAIPATIAAVASLRRANEARETRDLLADHADDDAAFQEWIVSRFERDWPDASPQLGDSEQ